MQKAPVPRAEHSHQHRQILLERSVGEMLVDGARASEELLEFFAADDEFRDQADRRPDRISPAHPIPHGKAVPGRDAEGVHGRGVGRDRDEMMRGRLIPQRSDDPGARRVRVGLRLLGGEGFRAHDHQGLRRIDAADQILELCAIHVRHEMRRDVAAPFGFERLCTPAMDPSRSRRCRRSPHA